MLRLNGIYIFLNILLLLLFVTADFTLNARNVLNLASTNFTKHWRVKQWLGRTGRPCLQKTTNNSKTLHFKFNCTVIVFKKFVAMTQFRAMKKARYSEMFCLRIVTQHLQTSHDFTCKSLFEFWKSHNTHTHTRTHIHTTHNAHGDRVLLEF